VDVHFELAHVFERLGEVLDGDRGLDLLDGLRIEALERGGVTLERVTDASFGAGGRRVWAPKGSRRGAPRQWLTGDRDSNRQHHRQQPVLTTFRVTRRGSNQSGPTDNHHPHRQPGWPEALREYHESENFPVRPK